MVPKGTETASSGELVRRAQAGDEAAWAALTERYSGRLWAVARSRGLGPADAADLVQLTWLRLVENIDSLRRPEAVGLWLMRTAHREAGRALRRRRPGPGELPVGLEGPAGPAGPDDVAVGREHLRAVFEAVHDLPDLCRRMLRLLALSSTYAELAVALDIPMGSVGPTRTRCLASLRKRLEGPA